MADHHLMTSLDDIAWTFNLRGRDVAFNPWW
ncbi:MAG: aminopeptidase P family N-terminal domain-containing protein [Saprospiraceae bacterium]|nr:aminopeptidase P family N-terminal domain-containing protein [Saprospiraceae bacterium]